MGEMQMPGPRPYWESAWVQAQKPMFWYWTLTSGVFRKIPVTYKQLGGYDGKR